LVSDANRGEAINSPLFDQVYYNLRAIDPAAQILPEFHGLFGFSTFALLLHLFNPIGIEIRICFLPFGQFGSRECRKLYPFAFKELPLCLQGMFWQ
jgi:hypothetical protein